jgi:hypothetical protein
MEHTDTADSRENAEKNSLKKVVFYLSDTEEDKKSEGYLGEFFVVGGEVKLKASSPNESDLLMGRLDNIWVPQLGFPVLKKTANGEFARNERKKLVIDKYVLPVNSPDEFIEALYDYTKAMGVYKVELVPV